MTGGAFRNSSSTAQQAAGGGEEFERAVKQGRGNRKWMRWKPPPERLRRERMDITERWMRSAAACAERDYVIQRLRLE